MQCHLVKAIPCPSRGLYETARSGVGNIDVTLDARRRPQERLLVHAACRRIGRTVGGELLSGRGTSPGNREKHQRKDRESKLREKDCRAALPARLLAFCRSASPHTSTSSRYAVSQPQAPEP